MGEGRTPRPWQFILIAVLIAVLLPVILAFFVFWFFATSCLYLLVWLLWCTRGKDILFVYSDSPIWHDHIEEKIIPRIESRAIILNWSKRRHWVDRWTLASFVFRHFGGSREFNPLAIYFPPLWFHQTFRFWNAFKDWKHGRTATLERLEDEFFRCIGHRYSGKTE